MRVLVDSHTFLWAVMAPGKLSALARSTLTSPHNDVFLSAVSLWELALKFSLGKLELEGILPDELSKAAANAGFKLISLDPEAAATFARLPQCDHKDPFDRMLIWQSIQSNFTLVSRDPELKRYTRFGLKILW